MSARARQIAGVVVLLLVVLVRAQQPGPFFSFGDRPEPFPRALAVVAPHAPSGIYDERPDIRILQLADSMEAMWSAAFTEAGDEYEPATVQTRAFGRETGCGDAVENWAGIYCPQQRTIVVDVDRHPMMRSTVGDDASDDRLAYVLAHEIGHHVQSLRGAVPISSERVLRAELHAECLAGVWGRAAGRAVPPEWSYAPDAVHGTVAQQQRWLELGHATGQPSACDAVWEDPSLGS